MKYFKNTELAKLYNVSEKSVRNWIHAAAEGKLDLETYEFSGKLFVANTSKNTALIEELVKKGKKFRNKRSYKTVIPRPDFYRIYGSQHIFDMIANMDIHREIPYEYSYFDEGAIRWDSYTRKLLGDSTSNTLNNTIHLMQTSYDYLDSLVEGFENVNIVDVGAGNGLPVRDLLQHFVNNGKLNRYIAVDMSKDLMTIAKKNIADWFDGHVPFEGYIRDINYDRFNDLLIPDSFTKTGDPDTINIVLFLGGTLANLREPQHALSTIYESMGKQDILLFTKKIDTPEARRYFDFSIVSGMFPFDFKTFRGKTIVDSLNIDESFYDVEQFFDEKNMVRQLQIRLKVALSIEFQIEDKKRHVDLNKGECLLLWRATHQTTSEVIDQFETNSFGLLQATKNTTQDYLLLITKIEPTNLRW